MLVILFKRIRNLSLAIFPPFSRAAGYTSLTCFSALATCDMFTRACHHLHQGAYIPFSALVTCFPALVIGYMFLRACLWLHVFSRFPSVTCSPALSIGYMFSRDFCRLHVFPRLTLVACFVALVVGYMFFRA